MHYSSYTGNYSSYKGAFGEKYELLNNYSEEEGWVLDEHKDLTVILRVNNSPISDEHRAGKFTGWHHFPSRLPNERVRIKDFGAGGLVRDSNGVYKATAEASFDGGKTWVEKTAKDHTFFPNEWSKEQVVDEIAGAFKQGRDKNPLPGYDFSGRSQSGVYIAGYLDGSGKIVSAFPIFGK